ncbi:hypothetical protein Ciccas_012223 [Cichlidogyrus casuarinus]|uniref:Uncharacterized protein n=1 Tax=Cichlidogyrus casuarinus TaxID=1844966 RepID=A0ABD2PQT7_9PLAT
MQNRRKLAYLKQMLVSCHALSQCQSFSFLSCMGASQFYDSAGGQWRPLEQIPPIPSTDLYE